MASCSTMAPRMSLEILLARCKTLTANNPEMKTRAIKMKFEMLAPKVIATKTTSEMRISSMIYKMRTRNQKGVDSASSQTMNAKTMNAKTMNAKTMNAKTMNAKTMNAKTMNAKTMNAKTMKRTLEMMRQEWSLAHTAFLFRILILTLSWFLGIT